MTESARCRLCGSKAKFLFVGKVLQVHDVSYFQCESCGFVQTEEPWWLAEAYSSVISDSDTGLIGRNVVNVRKTATVLYFLFDCGKSFLDYGGGWGLFTRMMRDTGFDFYWHDPHCENIFARGFSLEDNVKEFDVVTAYEVFEHLVDPLSEINKMLSLGKNIIFSTSLLPEPVPPLEKWWYYSPDHGQHISFYTKKSLETIAKKLSLHLTSNDRDLHMLSASPVSHLLWGALLRFSRILFPFYVQRVMEPKTIADSSRVKDETLITGHSAHVPAKDQSPGRSSE